MFLNKNNSTEHLKVAALYSQLSSLLKDVSVQPLNKTKFSAFLRRLAAGYTEIFLVRASNLGDCVYIYISRVHMQLLRPPYIQHVSSTVTSSKQKQPLT